MDFVTGGITPKIGIHYDVPWAEYARWNAFSQSLVSTAMQSINKMEYRLAHGQKNVDAFALGSLVDAMLLEPDRINLDFAIQPTYYEKVETTGRGQDKISTTIQKPWNMRSNTCKQITAELIASGKTIISESKKSQAENMCGVVWANSEAANIIERCKKQVSVFWIDSDHDIPCKARFDLFEDDKIWDLKTTVDASKNSFQRSIGKFGYHVQAGTYREAINVINGVNVDYGFIAVESCNCPECAVYQLDTESMDAGLIQFKMALRKIRKYIDGEDSGSYSQFIEPISAPEWIIRQINKEHDEDTELW